jgi:hypothetical protein
LLAEFVEPSAEWGVAFGFGGALGIDASARVEEPDSLSNALPSCMASVGRLIFGLSWCSERDQWRPSPSSTRTPRAGRACLPEPAG